MTWLASLSPIQTPLEQTHLHGVPLPQAIGQLVCQAMGGPAPSNAALHKRWLLVSKALKTRQGSVVVPIGQLRVGLTRHRALLFKALADETGILPCSIIAGQSRAGEMRSPHML